MDGIKETGYLFLNNYNLSELDIRRHFIRKIKEVELQENINLTPYNLYINIVQNKDHENLGYAYVWVDKAEIYHLFCGDNLDGSKRFIEYPDPDWSEPEYEEPEDTGCWGDLADEEAKYQAPVIREKLAPLVDIHNYSEEINIPIQPLILYERGRNVIYSKNIESWLTEKVFKFHLDKFEKDKSTYKNKQKNLEYTYPLIKFRGNNVNIIFSPKYPNTASFLIKVIKKIKIKYQDKEKLIFFSQSKN